MQAILRGLHARDGSPSPELLLTWPVCAQDGGGRRVLSSPGWTQPLLREGWSHCLHAPYSISPQTCQKMRGINKPHPHCPPQGGAGGGAAREPLPYMELVWVRQFPCSCWGDEGPWGPAAARGVAGSPHPRCLRTACELLIIAMAAKVTAAAGHVPGLRARLPVSGSSPFTHPYSHLTDEETEARKG